jgi:hypothetical protein
VIPLPFDFPEGITVAPVPTYKHVSTLERCVCLEVIFDLLPYRCGVILAVDTDN